MSEGNGQKKILYLAQILLQETDEQHPVSMPKILEKLAGCGITAERKSIYGAIEQLRVFGLDIIGEKRDSGFVYYIGSRTFELPELKLLADSVQAARFISEKKSRELIRKLGTLTSGANAAKLDREVLLAKRVKSESESLFYTVDTIYTAMNAQKQLTFHYFSWNSSRKKELKHNGALYSVSPWNLLWDSEYYYLIAVDRGMIKHFRVDKILDCEVSGQDREGREIYEAIDIATYPKRMFGMFAGKESRVELLAEERFAGILFDRFGKDIMMIPKEDGKFKAILRVSVSDQFLSWIFSLGEGIRITGPEEVLEETRKMLTRLSHTYQEILTEKKEQE